MAIEKWPADNPDAKDPLERRNFERCLVDSTYAEANATWFKYAHRERARRAAAEANAQHQADVNASRLTRFEEQAKAEREDAARGVDKRIARTAAATLRLQRNSRRW